MNPAGGNGVTVLDCLLKVPVGLEFVGYEGLEKFSDSLQSRFPGAVFRLAGRPQRLGDAIRTYWNFGPPAKPDAVSGMDSPFCPTTRCAPCTPSSMPPPRGASSRLREHPYLAAARTARTGYRQRFTLVGAVRPTRAQSGSDGSRQKSALRPPPNGCKYAASLGASPRDGGRCSVARRFAVALPASV
jgi:hypothetical protein